MNRTFLGLLIKFIATFVAVWICFGLIYRAENSVLWMFVVAIVITLVNYMIGDLLILRKYGNVAASIGDGVMAALVAYIISLITDNFNVNWMSIIVFIILIIISEYFLHKYIVHDDDY